MPLLGPLLCLLCSFITCIGVCDAAPVQLCASASSRCLDSSNPLQVELPLGSVRGAQTGYGAQRFSLPYAQPPVGSLRFAPCQSLTAFTNTSTVYDASNLPKACMQTPNPPYKITSGSVSEDCLYLNVFRPSSSGSAAKPVLVWIHGGSFVSGSSTAPGLDGSYLATQNDLIVVTLQYRLGIFGFFSPSSDPSIGNQGISDVITALKFLRDNIASFGGDPASITLAGQSSGAHLIRSLLSSPNASPLFHKAILQSDPANFGTQTLATSQLVSEFAMEQTPCSDVQCLRGMGAADLAGVSSQTAQAAGVIGDAVATAEVWRPYLGDVTGDAFEKDPGASLSAAAKKPIVITTVENEGGSVVGSMLEPTSVDAESAELRAYPVSLSRDQLIQQMFNDGRGTILASAAQYAMSSNTSAYPVPATVQLFSKATDSLRRNLEALLTQGMFTCPTWSNAQRYPQAYVGIFEKGLTYPSNADNDYCTAYGRVCHEDDILLVFSDPNKVVEERREVVKEVQARWIAFTKTGSPNAGQYQGWEEAGNGQQAIKAMRLGASASGSTMDSIALKEGQYAGCGEVWGGEVKFDWQLYG